MPANLSVFLDNQGSGENVAGGGGIDEAALNQGVERGLKRARLESAGDDSGVPTKGFKVYKPDEIDPSDGSANPLKYNFGPVFQLRDLDSAPGGGILVSKPSESTLRLTIGGVAGTHSTSVQRPEKTAVFRPSLGFSQDSMDLTAPLVPVLYNTLYDPPVQFFSSDASPSIAFVTKEVHAVHGTSYYRKDYVGSTEPQGDDTGRTRNDFLIETHFTGGVELRGEVLKHVDDSLVEDPTNEEDPNYIPVGALSDRENYIHVYLYNVGTGAQSTPEMPLIWGPPDSTHPAHISEKYSCWSAGEGNGIPVTQEQLLGPDTVVTSQTELRWETLPEQVYALEQGILELSGSSVADIKAQEDIQNERIASLERETGLAEATTTPPNAEVQFPDTCLVQRFEYLDKLARGITAEGSGAIFATTNPAVSLAPFRCPPTTIRGADLSQQPPFVDLPTTPLFNAEDLYSKGALGLLWALLPRVQEIRDALLRVSRDRFGVLSKKMKYVIDIDSQGQLLTQRNVTDADHNLAITGFAYFRPAPLERKIPGTEIMTLCWPHPSDALYRQEFDIDMRTRILPEGFVLYPAFAQTGPDAPEPLPLATHLDPSNNDVSDPYMPVDLLDRRSGPLHLLRYRGTDPDLIAWLGNSFIPLEYEGSANIPQAIEQINLTTELERIDLELLRLGAQVTAAYGPLRGLNDRLARLEAWREAF